MPGWLKALLTVAIVVVLLIVGVVGAGLFWWMRNKDALKYRMKEVVAEGRDFGAHSDNRGCVDETMSRYKKEPGFFSAFKYQGFINGCLEKSSPTVGFCEGIPIGDFMKMTAWREGECRRYGLANDRNCQPLLMPVMMSCGEKRRKEN